MGRPALREELLEVYRWLSERKVGRRGWRYCGAWSMSSSSVPDRPGWPWATTCAARACGRPTVTCCSTPTPLRAGPGRTCGLRCGCFPAEYSSLPGWPMPPAVGDGFPLASHVVDYLTRYEHRYDLPVQHGVRATAVRRLDANPEGRLLVETTAGRWAARAVVSATGTWGRPLRPELPRDDLLRRSPAAQRSLHRTGRLRRSARRHRRRRQHRRPARRRARTR